MSFRVTPKTTQGWVDLHAEKEEEIARLKSIIRHLLKHIEDGTLVRDISKDGDAGWALSMMRLVVDLKNATEAVEPQ
jgi:hypothetical protein